MDKVEDQHLPSHTHVHTPQTAKRSKRFWVFALLAGMFIVCVNLRSVLNGTSWKPPYTGCGKRTKPRSHYTLPSGDKIPSVALGGATPSSCLARRFTYFSSFASGVWKASRGEVGQAVKAALAAGYRHIDGAWAYGVRTLTLLPGRIHQSKQLEKHLHTE